MGIQSIRRPQEITPQTLTRLIGATLGKGHALHPVRHARLFLLLSLALTEYELRGGVLRATPASVSNKRLTKVRSALRTLALMRRDLDDGKWQDLSAHTASAVRGALVRGGEKTAAPSGVDPASAALEAVNTLLHLADKIDRWPVNRVPRDQKASLPPKKWLIGIALPDIFDRIFSHGKTSLARDDFTLEVLEKFGISPQRGTAWDAETLSKYRVIARRQSKDRRGKNLHHCPMKGG